MARKKSPALTDAKLRLMDIIGERQSASAAEFLQALPDADLAYTTVLNTLRILEAKGYLRHTPRTVKPLSITRWSIVRRPNAPRCSTF